MTSKKRPTWAEQNDKMREYYDHYWGFPLHNDHQLFELFSLEIFQAGLSWNGVWQKRAALRRAFADFQINRVAAMDHDDFLRLMRNRSIIRNQRKILATIHNAQAAQQIKRQRRIGFAEYCWQLVDNIPQPSPVGEGEDLPPQTVLSKRVSQQLHRDGFSGVGPVVAMSFLCASGMIDVRQQKNSKKC
ncbi:DNA-3-methyladenine glycosylase I [uncultured Limosilactobacillus sp.]|uniref:DNA-3-methyladenine glycosylase I n=1 Tax=uncultured Limosilactobacillus sp. TaxID=2837629 RepID=UPI0025D3E0E5|nr:DNA-3-methyladenine glycosylase I [uncultured Limosilactobacillus sp.]